MSVSSIDATRVFRLSAQEVALADPFRLQHGLQWAQVIQEVRGRIREGRAVSFGGAIEDMKRDYNPPHFR
jgi:hypothetical protein